MTHRIIKFRAWDFTTKTFSEISFSGNNYIGALCVPMYGELGQKYTYQQFTGLSDKNEKDIYEGDILEVDDEEYKYQVEFARGKFIARYQSEIREGGNCLGAVITCDDFFVWERGNESPFHGTPYELKSTVKVIGNIFENPELLK